MALMDPALRTYTEWLVAKPASRREGLFLVSAALIGVALSHHGHGLTYLSPEHLSKLAHGIIRLLSILPAPLRVGWVVLGAGLVLLPLAVPALRRIRPPSRRLAAATLQMVAILVAIQLAFLGIEEMLELSGAGEAVADGAPWSILALGLVGHLPVARAAIATLHWFSRIRQKAPRPAIAPSQTLPSYPASSSRSGLAQRFPLSHPKRGPPAPCAC
jgi:hypothetical protein